MHINGGGAATRQDAERQCLDAITFALEGDPSEYDSDAQAVALEVSVALPPDQWLTKAIVLTGAPGASLERASPPGGIEPTWTGVGASL